MSDVRVVEALDSSLRAAFVELPYRLYRDDRAWVAPLRGAVRGGLDPRKNPFSSHGLFVPLVALRGDRVVGRVMAIDDRGYNQCHRTHHGFFGLLEAEADGAVLVALLDGAAAWCKSRGADLLLGPRSFSWQEDCGLLVEGFGEPPRLGLCYSGPDYPELIEGCGFRKAWDTLAYDLPVDREPSNSVLHFTDAVRRSHRIVVRHADPRRYEEELTGVLRIYNQAFGENLGFSPITADEQRRMLRTLRPLLRPELVFLALVDGEPVGFSLGLPDLNEALRHLRGRLLGLGLVRFLHRVRRLRALRICSLGVLPAYRQSGLTSVLILETLGAARRLGYEAVELSPVLENNQQMTQGITAIGGEIRKRWRVYQRPILVRAGGSAAG